MRYIHRGGPAPSWSVRYAGSKYTSVAKFRSTKLSPDRVICDESSVLTDECKRDASSAHTVFGATHVGHSVTNQFQNGWRRYREVKDLQHRCCAQPLGPWTCWASRHTYRPLCRSIFAGFRVRAGRCSPLPSTSRV